MIHSLHVVDLNFEIDPSSEGFLKIGCSPLALLEFFGCRSLERRRFFEHQMYGAQTEGDKLFGLSRVFDLKAEEIDVERDARRKIRDVEFGNECRSSHGPVSMGSPSAVQAASPPSR